MSLRISVIDQNTKQYKIFINIKDCDKEFEIFNLLVDFSLDTCSLIHHHCGSITVFNGIMDFYKTFMVDENIHFEQYPRVNRMPLDSMHEYTNSYMECFYFLLERLYQDYSCYKKFNE